MDQEPDCPRASDPSRKLDFSRYHDLGHRPFSVDCRSAYGGPVHHLALWWEYRVHLPARRWVRRNTRCRVGLHDWRAVWITDAGREPCCGDCRVSYER